MGGSVMMGLSHTNPPPSPIKWHEEGGDWIGVDPETHYFSEVTWRVRGSHVYFRVPANPPYWSPTFSRATDSAVLASRDAHLLAAQP
jgi:hypothetical protein